MEQTLFRIHVRTVTSVCATVNRPCRIIIEKILLFVAIMSLVALYLVHSMYVSHSAQNCLQYVLDKANIHHKDVDMLSVTLTNDWTTLSIFNIVPQAMSWNVSEFTKNLEWALTAESKVGYIQPICSNANESSHTVVARFVLSSEKGYLHLSEDAKVKHNISTASVFISAQEVCFGPPAYVYLLDAYAGYSTVMKNWAVRTYEGMGFVYNIDTEESFDMSDSAAFLNKTGSTVPQKYSPGHFSSISSIQHFIAFKVGILLSTLFLFFTTTTLVSFTLRATQEKMLKFTFLLQYYVNRRMPYEHLVLTHLVETLVFVPVMIGMMFFLFEFFQDQMLAFLVLTTVWFYEVYAAVSLRTAITMKFFPKIFFVYFSLYHIYVFSFPLGFSYVALASTVIFLAHAMWYFWIYFEVPAFEAGKITAHEPRARIVGSILATSELSSVGSIREYQHYRRTEALGAADVAVNNHRLFVAPLAMSSSQDRTRRGSMDNDENAMATESANSNASGATSSAAPSTSRFEAGNAIDTELSSHGLNSLSPPEEQDSSATMALSRTREAGISNVISPPRQTAPRSARELYDEHVALSKRIQRQQLAAMLGIGLDFEIHGNDSSRQDVGMNIDN